MCVCQHYYYSQLSPLFTVCPYCVRSDKEEEEGSNRPKKTRTFFEDKKGGLGKKGENRKKDKFAVPPFAFQNAYITTRVFQPKSSYKVVKSHIRWVGGSSKKSGRHFLLQLRPLLTPHSSSFPGLLSKIRAERNGKGAAHFHRSTVKTTTVKEEGKTGTAKKTLLFFSRPRSPPLLGGLVFKFIGKTPSFLCEGKLMHVGRNS